MLPSREPPFAPTPPYGGEAEASLSGLTDIQAREFNRLFLLSFLIFTAIAILAHIAAWAWRPWGHATEPSQLRQPPATATSMLVVPHAGAAPPVLVLSAPKEA